MTKMIDREPPSLTNMVSSQDNCLSPGVKTTKVEGMIPEEYPFRKDLEELLGTPLERTSREEGMEDGEIVGTKRLQILANTQVGENIPETSYKVSGMSPLTLGSSSTQAGDLMSIEGECKELVCTPMRVVKASPAEIAVRVMESINKIDKEISSSPPQEEDNGEWEVQKKKRRGGRKLDIGISGTTGRSTRKVTRTK